VPITISKEEGQHLNLRQRCAAIGAVIILAACSVAAAVRAFRIPVAAARAGAPTRIAPGYGQADIKFRVPIKGKARMKVTALGHKGHPDYISPATAQVNFTFDSYTGSLNLTSPPAAPWTSDTARR